METVIAKETDNIASLLYKANEGTEFIFPENFVYRNFETLRPKNETVLRNLKLNGSKIMDKWLKQSGYWISPELATTVLKASTDYLRSTTGNNGGYDRANWNLVLFRDDLPLRHVTSISQLDNDSWYFEEKTKIVWISFDPTNYFMEFTQKTRFIDSNSKFVILDNCHFEKCASQVGQGAVLTYLSSDWIIKNCTFMKNASVGLSIGSNALVENCAFVHNGQAGAGVGGGSTTKEDIVIRNCYFGFNNFQRISEYWDGSALKITNTKNLLFSGNTVEKNKSNGLWVDINNIGTIVSNNKFMYNTRNGVYNEIGYSCEISDNLFVGNGFTKEFWNNSEGQIRVSNNKDVNIHDNIMICRKDEHAFFVFDGQRGGSYLTRNLKFDNNHIYSLRETVVTANENLNDLEFYKSISFSNNKYALFDGQLKFIYKNIYDLPNWNKQSFSSNETETEYPSWLVGYLEEEKTDTLKIVNGELKMVGTVIPQITKFIVVDTDTNTDFLEFGSGLHLISVSEMPEHFSIRVETTGTNKVQFNINGIERTEYTKPYAIFENTPDNFDGAKAEPYVWEIVATPYNGETIGNTQTFTLDIYKNEVIEIEGYSVKLKTSLPVASFDVYTDDGKISNISVSFFQENNSGGDVEITIE